MGDFSRESWASDVTWLKAASTLSAAVESGLDITPLTGFVRLIDGLYHENETFSSSFQRTCLSTPTTQMLEVSFDEARLNPEKFCKLCAHTISLNDSMQMLDKHGIRTWVSVLDAALKAKEIVEPSTYEELRTALADEQRDLILSQHAPWAQWISELDPLMSIKDAALYVRRDFLSDFSLSLAREVLEDKYSFRGSLEEFAPDYKEFSEGIIARLLARPGWRLAPRPSSKLFGARSTKAVDLALALELYAIKNVIFFPAHLEPFFEEWLFEPPLHFDAPPAPDLLENVSVLYNPKSEGPYGSLETAWIAAAKV